MTSQSHVGLSVYFESNKYYALLTKGMTYLIFKKSHKNSKETNKNTYSTHFNVQLH